MKRNPNNKELLLPRLRQRWHSIQLRWRLLIYLLCFCVLMICLLWVFQISYLDRFYERVKINQIEQTAASLVEAIDGEQAVLFDLAEDLGQQREICISIYRVSEGTFTTALSCLCQVDVLGDCTIHHGTKKQLEEYYNQAKLSGGIYENRVSRQAFRLESGAEFLKLVSPTYMTLPDSLIYSQLIEGKSGQYMLLLNSSISPVGAVVSTLRIQLIWISLILILAAALLSTILANHLSRPIAKLTRSARRLASGDFSGGFEGGSFRELNELADTLNNAAYQLGKSEKLQRDILANISHDLRTPLTMIGGYAEFMRDFPEEDHSESLEVITGETKRLSKLIKDVLDLSQLNSGVQQLNAAPFDLSESLREFARSYNHLIAPDGYQVELRIDQDVTVLADETKIIQAVGNMINNAMTHCGEDKLIILEQQVIADQVRVFIIDHGCGISEEDLPYIWDRYYHADAPQRAGKGSGLGLSIVKGIMELHRAEYGVESELGEGSSFWFQLPLYRDEE